jgi:hypothetical protein
MRDKDAKRGERDERGREMMRYGWSLEQVCTKRVSVRLA